tara:strand:- start:648 stop:1025 length:378 start_codon:yes stop_codon:yes gene_type:complete
MRLYTNNKGEWTGTQADAKKAWGKDMALVEVPVSKDALMKWLNKCRVVSQSHAEIAEQFNTPTPDDNARLYITPKGSSALSRSATSIDELNQYDVHDVVLNCDRKHLGSALSAIINRLHDEVDEV